MTKRYGFLRDAVFSYPLVIEDKADYSYITTGEYKGETGILTGGLRDLDGDGKSELLVFSVQQLERQTENGTQIVEEVVCDIYQESFGKVESADSCVLSTDLAVTRMHEEIFLKKMEDFFILGSVYYASLEGAFSVGIQLFRFQNDQFVTIADGGGAAQHNGPMLEIADLLEKEGFSEDLSEAWRMDEFGNIGVSLMEDLIPLTEPGIERILSITTGYEGFPGDGLTGLRSPFAEYLTTPEATFEDFEEQFSYSFFDWSRQDIMEFEQKFYAGEYRVNGEIIISDDWLW